MRKVSVGSVNNILLILAQSLYYVVYYKGNNTLTSTSDFLVTIESYCYHRHFTITHIILITS